MRHYGVFDVTGPIMVGPSSSHTAGAARLGLIARRLCGESVAKVTFYLHGSFARTYHGHGTDKALLAGILGIDSADYRLRDAFEIAQSQGLHYEFIPTDLGDVHPNTVRFELTTKSGRQCYVLGSSIGGGSVRILEIDGVQVNFSGDRPILVTSHRDEPGVVARVTAILYRYGINIGNMQINRDGDDGDACMYLELEGWIPPGLKAQLRGVEGIRKVLLLDSAPLRRPDKTEEGTACSK